MFVFVYKCNYYRLPMSDSESDDAIEADFAVGEAEIEEALATRPAFDQVQFEADTNLTVPPKDADLSAIANFITRACEDEEARGIIGRLTHLLGREPALYYLQLATSLQKSSGGIATKDGSRDRTVAGMFLRLIRDDPRIPDHERREWFKAGKHKFFPEARQAMQDRAKRRIRAHLRRQQKRDARAEEWLESNRQMTNQRSPSPRTTAMTQNFRHSSDSTHPSDPCDPPSPKRFPTLNHYPTSPQRFRALNLFVGGPSATISEPPTFQGPGDSFAIGSGETERSWDSFESDPNQRHQPQPERARPSRKWTEYCRKIRQEIASKKMRPV